MRIKFKLYGGSFGNSSCYFLLYFLFISFFLTAKAQDKTTLITIGGKIITPVEFLERSEFTVKPAQLKDKNSILQNLISEKILSIEAEKNNSAILLNPLFTAKIRGITEQAMRDVLYKAETYDKIEPDSVEIERFYRNSMREYQLEFYLLNSDSLVSNIMNVLKKQPQHINGIFKELETSLGKRPLHNIKFFDPDDEILTETLYSSLLDTGTVIGPLRISSGDRILMRVSRWADHPVIGDEDQKIRWNKVSEKLSVFKAGKKWRAFVNSIMGNKIIKFEPENFRILSQMAFEHYKKITDTLNVELREIALPSSTLNMDAHVFIVDDKTWSFNDFKTELLSHPLVYRTKNLNQNNYKHQFELAIIDLMRDHYLTEEAYKRNYDSDMSVKRTTELWKDFYLAIQQENEILNSAVNKGIIKENDNSAKINYWETYLKGLYKKYEDEIVIDYDEYDKIKLTGIDMITVRTGVPYPLAVPAFPRFIYPDKDSYLFKIHD